MYRPSAITPIDREIVLEEDDLIVSKTDTAGRIIYSNDCFCRIAGYSHQELMGKPHSIVRHPCMPRATFALMWQHLKDEKEFIGYVHNMARDGSYYWTFASVAPTYENGELVGYLSSRRCPRRDAIERVESIYIKMRDAESKLSEDKQIQASTEILMQEVTSGYQSYAEFILSV